MSYNQIFSEAAFQDLEKHLGISFVWCGNSHNLTSNIWEMGEVYEEVEIEDMTFSDELQEYTYPCPCGDKFSISLEELWRYPMNFCFLASA